MTVGYGSIAVTKVLVERCILLLLLLYFALVSSYFYSIFKVNTTMKLTKYVDIGIFVYVFSHLERHINIVISFDIIILGFYSVIIRIIILNIF